MARYRVTKPSGAGRRREAPALLNERNGQPSIDCPFCFPTHTLVVGQDSHCGTRLELKAVQRLYTAVECAKCHKSDGTLTKIDDEYQHTHDCTPGKLMFHKEPVPSKSAQRVFKLPKWLRERIQIRRQQAAVRLEKDGGFVYAWIDFADLAIRR